MPPLIRNIFANYVGTGIVALAPLLALPWYLAALGPKQFGLISFIVMLQAVFGLLDAGMSQALTREFAVRINASQRGLQDCAELLFGFERIYWLFALGTGCVVLLFANSIATHWLNLEDRSVALGREAVLGAAAIFAMQFPGSIYRSLLTGAQAQIKLNGALSGCALLRHLGGVMIVSIWPTLSVYLIWQVAIALLETLLRARLAWDTLNVAPKQLTWSIEKMLPTWRLVAGMSGASWLGALTVQMDKIVLSRMASIEQFGYYTIAATLGTGMLQLIYPLMQAALPRAVQLRTKPIALRSLYLKLLALVALLTAVIALVYWSYGEWILHAWLKNGHAAATVYPLVAILLIGTTLNAFYNVGYIDWIVQGKTWRVLRVNFLALILSVILIPVFVTWKGITGAAFGWLAINFIGFTFSLEWLKRKAA